MPDNEPGPEVCFYIADLTAGPDGRIALVRISPLSRSATAWLRIRKECRLQKNSQFNAEGIRVPAVAGQRAAVADVQVAAFAGLDPQAEFDVENRLAGRTFDHWRRIGLDDRHFSTQRRPTDELGHRRYLPCATAQSIVMQSHAIDDDIAGKFAAANGYPIAAPLPSSSLCPATGRATVLVPRWRVSFLYRARNRRWERKCGIGM